MIGSRKKKNLKTLGKKRSKNYDFSNNDSNEDIHNTSDEEYSTTNSKSLNFNNKNKIKDEKNTKKSNKSFNDDDSSYKDPLKIEIESNSYELGSDDDNKIIKNNKSNKITDSQIILNSNSKITKKDLSSFKLKKREKIINKIEDLDTDMEIQIKTDKITKNDVLKRFEGLVSESKNNKNNSEIINIEDLDRIDITNINNNVYLRDEEKNEIKNFLNEKKSRIIYISGQPGTGKTSLILNLIKDKLSINLNCSCGEKLLIDKNVELMNIIKEDKTLESAVNFDFVININCLSIENIYDVYKRIFQELEMSLKQIKLYLNQFSKDLEVYNSLKDMLNRFKSDSKGINTEIYKKYFMEFLTIANKKMLPIIVLDEVDGIYSENKINKNEIRNQLYFKEFIKLPYVADCELKIIMICNNSEFDKKLIDCIFSEMKAIKTIIFKPYTHFEMKEILQKLLESAGMKNLIDDQALGYIAMKSSNLSGDIRKGIGHLKNIFLNYFNKNIINKESLDNKKINLHFVINYFKPKDTLFEEVLKKMTTDQKIAVLAIYKVLEKNPDSKDITEHEVLKQYKLIKQIKFHTFDTYIGDFQETIKLIQDFGILEYKRSGKNVLSYKLKKTKEEFETIFKDDFIFKMMNEDDSENFL